MADIEIVASAVGFDQVNKALNNTNKSLNETATGAKKAGDALNNQLRPGAAQANTAMTNLSRVVQDAPFGFIGIANNLDPLIQSFQSLRKETGSTGGAIKALVSGLTGGGGLALAFSAITTAITFASIGFDRWFKSTDESKKSTKDLADSLRSAEQSALATGIQLQAYVDVARNNQLSLEQRNEALKQANKIMGEHGEKLTLVNINTDKVTKSVELYTQAMIAQSVAQKYTDKIADLTIKKNELNNQKTLDQIELQKANIALTQQQIKAQGDAYALAYGVTAYLDDRNKKESKLKATEKELIGINTEINNLTAELTKNTLNATSAFGTLGTKQKETTEKTKKAAQTLEEYLKEFRESVKDEINIGIAFGDPRFVERIRMFQTTIEGVISKFNVDPKSQLVIGLQTELARLEIDKFISEIPSMVQMKAAKAKPIDLNNLLKLDPNKFVKSIPPLKLDDWRKKFGDDLSKAFTDFKSQSFIDAITSFADSISNVIVGKMSFADAFKNVFASLGENIKQLGQQLIKIGVLAKIAQTQLFMNPTAAIAAGVGLVILGGVLRGLMAKNAFATGTSFAPGGMALVGERGPELVNLPRGSQVIPAAQTASMIGGRNSVEVYGILRGQDIYFSNKKYSQTYNRQS